MRHGLLLAAATGLIVASVVSASVLADAQTPAAPTTSSAVASGTQRSKPTVVLVHGAWADAAGWTPVVQRLQQAGYPVVAPPNPLRGLTSDAAYISAVLSQITGPIVLVGHSYGGAVITNAARGHANVRALVYIAAFAPDKGESLQSLNGSRLGREIPPVPVTASTYPDAGGGTGTELTIEPAAYPGVFLVGELPAGQAAALAVEQRPLAVAATSDLSGPPAWKTIPSWYLVSKDDRAISPDLERFMAARAKAHTVETATPHLVMLTDPAPVTALIISAAAAR